MKCTVIKILPNGGLGRERLQALVAWVVLALVVVSYSVLHPSVISTCHDFPIVVPAAISTFQHWPPSAKPFFYALVVQQIYHIWEVIQF